MPHFIAFDLDGVLYSSEPFLGEAYRESIARVNVKRPGSFERVPSTREILDHVGWPVHVILKRLFPGVDPQAVTLLYAETLDVICEGVARREGVLFDGVPETLRVLHEAGYRLGIASNGRTRYVETVLATYRIGDYFVPLVTADQVGSKSAILEQYMVSERIGVETLIMVGDRSSDVEAARAVGARFIGCDYGHGYRSEIEHEGPIASSFAELPLLLRSLDA